MKIVDSCGEEGDLFFLLGFLLNAVKNDAELLLQLICKMLEVCNRHAYVTPLSLSKRELATMAA